MSMKTSVATRIRSWFHSIINSGSLSSAIIFLGTSCGGFHPCIPDLPVGDRLFGCCGQKDALFLIQLRDGIVACSNRNQLFFYEIQHPIKNNVISIRKVLSATNEIYDQKINILTPTLEAWYSVKNYRIWYIQQQNTV